MSEFECFRDDPSGFVNQVLGADLWRKQREILEAVRDERRVAVRSCNGSGKTFLAAHAVLWWVMTRDEGVAITTAPTGRQVEELLWREIRGAFHRNEAKLPGKMTKTSLELSPRNYALGISTDRAERFQGFHAGEILFVVDEASGVSDQIFNAIRGSMTSPQAKMLLIGNPNSLSGAFYEAFHRQYKHWHTIRITAFDCIEATDKSELATSRLVTASWVADMAALEGEDSTEYQVRVLGEFPSMTADSLISVSSIEQAIARWQNIDVRGEALDNRTDIGGADGDIPEVVVGLDVARFGDDRSVACARKGPRVLGIEAWKGADAMETSGRALEFARRYGACVIAVDESGVGGGVLDRMREVGGVASLGVNVGRAARNSERFANLRAELFNGLKLRFNNGDIEIPDDRELASELASLRYFFTSRGQLQLESKRKYAGVGVASPDKADALMLAFSVHATENDIDIQFG